MGTRGVEPRCAGAVDAAGVVGGEMGEDVLDEFGRLDAGDDAQRAATHATVPDVDMEDALKPLHPAHGRATRRLMLAGGLVDRVGNDAVAVLEVRCEHAMGQSELGSRERHFRGGEAGDAQSAGLPICTV